MRRSWIQLRGPLPASAALAACMALSLSACTSSGLAARGPAGEDAVVAIVDGVAVPAEEYRAWLADVYGLPPREDYLGLWLLEREATRRGIEVRREEIDRAREELLARWVRERCRGDEGGLDEELARQGHDRESFRRSFHWQKLRELLAQRLVMAERTIDDTALRRRFEVQYGPGGVRTKVRLLVLTRSRLSLEISREPETRTPTAAELDQLLRERAEALRERVRAGESFESIVRAESADLSAVKDGGMCGDDEWRLRGAALVAAVEGAPIGGVQAPVSNSSGIDLFEVVSRDTTRFEDVRETLRAELEAAPPSLEEILALDRKLRAAAVVETPGR